MELAKHVLDKTILDVNEFRAGKADDLILSVADEAEAGHAPRLTVLALVTGPMALARNLPPPLRWLCALFYRLLGVANPRPLHIGWDHVLALDVVVHINLDRDDTELRGVPHAVARRYISRLPGA